MRTEITIPFAFDTAPIEEKIQNDGEAEAMRIVEEMVREGITKAMPQANRYTYDYYGKKPMEPEINWKKYVDERFGRFLNDHSQEIIDEAAMLLAMKAGRKKAWREVLTEYKEETDEHDVSDVSDVS